MTPAEIQQLLSSPGGGRQISLYEGRVNILFDPREHAYFRVDGHVPEIVPSVTTVLGVLDKPALVQWAANECADYFPRAWDSTEPKPDGEKAIRQWLLETSMKARTASKSVQRTALNIGSVTHDLLERFLREHIGETITSRMKLPAPRVGALGPTGPSALTENEMDAVMSCAEAARSWMASHEFKPIKTEAVLYSLLYGYCGTVDTVGLVDGVLTVADWKSSARIYDEYPVQTAAYLEAHFEETGQAAMQRVICRLGKTDGKFEAVSYGPETQADDFQKFLHCLALWRAGRAEKKETKRRKNTVTEVRQDEEGLSKDDPGVFILQPAGYDNG
jgi:hypothetical protein